MFDRKAIEQALCALEARFGARLSRHPAVCEQHGRGEAHPLCAPPDAVVFPESTDEVAEILRICHGCGCPVVPYGAGTSLEGQVCAVAGGVCLDLSRMNRILEVSEEDLDARVEAGVTRRQLNRELASRGLFFSVDPGADASLGGMAATRATGTNTVRYGGMRDNVLALTVVLADGRVVRTGARARKSAAGYDLTRLFLGSEGTLGVITELRLRLWPLPEAVAAAVCPFPSLEAAVDAVVETVQHGIPVARIELLDEQQMAASIRYSRLTDLEARPTLFYEFHGGPRAVEEQAQAASVIAQSHGGAAFRWARAVEERRRLWRARHDAYYAALALRPGWRAWVSDVCVPVSKLAEQVHAARRDLEEMGLLATILGHVGDGNFHVVVLLDPKDSDGWERLREVNRRMVARALACGGTRTGEHGIGLGKQESLIEELGDAVEVMRAIKRALDPRGILNPGKIFAQPAGEPALPPGP